MIMATCNWCEATDVPATHNLEDRYEWACDAHYAQWFLVEGRAFSTSLGAATHLHQLCVEAQALVTS